MKVVTVAVGNDVNEEELRHINPDEEAIVKVDTDQETESAVFAVARQVQGNITGGCEHRRGKFIDRWQFIL